MYGFLCVCVGLEHVGICFRSSALIGFMPSFNMPNGKDLVYTAISVFIVDRDDGIFADSVIAVREQK